MSGIFLKRRTAVIISNESLTGQKFSVISPGKAGSSFIGLIGESKGSFGKFKFSYKIDFSRVKISGKFKVVVASSRTSRFIISKNIYNEVVDTLMQFFNEY